MKLSWRERWVGAEATVADSARPYGDPYERDRIALIPAAEIRGVGGAKRRGWTRAGSGAAGLGLNAYLAGARAIEGGHMRRQPALDATTIGLGVISAELAVAFMLRRRNC